eukprot:scaffold897_cov402-Prasinococcus_capsulatus_cf.AAC.11
MQYKRESEIRSANLGTLKEELEKAWGMLKFPRGNKELSVSPNVSFPPRPLPQTASAPTSIALDGVEAVCLQNDQPERIAHEEHDSEKIEGDISSAEEAVHRRNAGDSSPGAMQDKAETETDNDQVPRPGDDLPNTT